MQMTDIFSYLDGVYKYYMIDFNGMSPRLELFYA